MLAVVDELSSRLQPFEFVAIAPPAGPLIEALQQRNISHAPLSFFDANGQRRSHADVEGDLQRVLPDAGPALVHANSLSMGRRLGRIANSLSIPCTAHLRDIIRLSAAAIRDLNCNRRLVAVSRATREAHVGQGLEESRTHVIHNGIDCERFAPRPSTGWLKRELGLPTSAFLIANIGQIGLRKGQTVLAEAAVSAARELPDAHYLLIGERHSAKAESIEFEQQIAATFTAGGLGDHLHHLGYRADIAGLLNEIDLLVHTARQEPLGRVLLEAAAAGVPIIATNVGGTSEILEDGVSACLVPPDNVECLSRALVEMVMDRQRREQFQIAARKRIEQNFTIAQAADSLAEFWMSAIANTEHDDD